MTAIGSRVAGGLSAAERAIRGLTLPAAVNLVVAALYWVISGIRNLDDADENLGPMEWDAETIALLAGPVLVMAAAHLVPSLKGRKILAGLRSGEDSARRSACRLALLSTAGLIVMGAWAYWALSIAEEGDGIATCSMAGMRESFGGLNSIGWTGLLSFLLVVALFAGTVAVALLTRQGLD
jgi:hypothetical protein